MFRLPLVAAALVALPASAQADFQMDTAPDPEHTCVLMAESHEHRYTDAAASQPTSAELDVAVDRWRSATNPDSRTVVTQGSSATFVVTYTGFEAYPMAQAAYESAVAIWADHLSSTVPISVTAEFAPLGTNVLGSAGPFLVRNFPGAPQTNVWYPYAMADAIAGVDNIPGAADLRSRFSSNFSNWYFGTDGNPPINQYDFRSVVLHELGHGLGFSGSGRWDDGATAGRCDGVSGNGCWGYNGSTFGGSPTVFDLHVEAGNRTPLLNPDVYPNPSPAIGSLLLSENVWAYGTRIDALPMTQRGQLYAPATWASGSSYSHWDEGRYYAGNANALMSPQIGPGERYSTPGPLTCAFFGDMGWPLGAGCANFVSEENGPAVAAEAGLRVTGANPFGSTTQVRLVLDTPQPVEAVLYDVTGRRVETLYSGDAAAGALTLAVRGDHLAAGVYAVRVVAGSETYEVRLVRTR